MGFTGSGGTVVVGADTCAQAEDRWPHADDQGEYGERLNDLHSLAGARILPRLGGELGGLGHRTEPAPEIVTPGPEIPACSWTRTQHTTPAAGCGARAVRARRQY